MLLGIILSPALLLSACRNSTPGSLAPVERAPAEGVLPPATQAPEAESEPSLENLGAEFHRLRAVRGHLSGAAGNWNDEVDKWGGRKQDVMSALGQRLGVPGTPKARLLEIMGGADETAHPGDPLWFFAGRKAPERASEMLVYYWRGLHDFLYFFVRDGQILDHGWWMAGE